jgi:GNAT superfamily N-acetyltransferase
MIKLVRTDSGNQDFIELVRHLDAELAEIDGSEHSFYARLNKIGNLKNVIVAYADDTPVGCGAIREFAPDAMEVKRMYTLPGYRGQGIATKILAALEAWATELGYKKCVLETGKRQPGAIALYKKSGYMNIPNYGQYLGVENSVCFEKEIEA